MIQCDKCGAENRLGAIFCIACGQRINLDNIPERIQEQQQRERHSPKRIFAIVRKIVAIAALILVVLILSGLFLGVPVQYPEAVPKATLQNAKMKFGKAKDKQFRSQSDPVLTITSAEATAIVNSITGLRQEKASEEDGEEQGTGFALAPKRISVELLSSGFVRLVLRSETFKGIDIYTTLIGRFVARDNQMEFIIQAGKIGKVSMPGPLRGIAVARFEPLLQNNKSMNNFLEAMDYVEASEDEAKVHLKSLDR
ncbi:MAG: zinc-ribbon domain-containing protein [Lentisphaeria bacterium]